MSKILKNILGNFSLQIYFLPLRSTGSRIGSLTHYYGLATSIVINFFVRNLWSIEADLFHSKDDEVANAFRVAHQSECNMTAVTIRNFVEQS